MATRHSWGAAAAAALTLVTLLLPAPTSTGAAAAAVTLSTPALTPARPIAHETTTVRGAFSAPQRRRVALQVRSGTTWRTSAWVTSATNGRFSFRTTFGGNRTVRFSAPAAGRWPAVVSRSRAVTLAAQQVVVSPSAPRTLPGTPVAITVTATPARPGRPVRLELVQDLNHGTYFDPVVVGQKAQDASGKATFTMTPPPIPTATWCACNRYVAQATALAHNGAPARVGRTLVTTGALSAPPPTGTVEPVGIGTTGNRPSAFSASLSADGTRATVFARPNDAEEPDTFYGVGVGIYDVDIATGTMTALRNGGDRILLPISGGGFHLVDRPWQVSDDGATVLLTATRHDMEGVPCSDTSCPEDDYPDIYRWRAGNLTRLTDAHVVTPESTGWGPALLIGMGPAGDTAVLYDPSAPTNLVVQSLTTSSRHGIAGDWFPNSSWRGTVSRDGTTMAVPPAPDLGIPRTALVDLADGSSTGVCEPPEPPGTWTVVQPLLSADGSTLVFSAHQDTGGSTYTCDLTTGEVRWIAFTGAQAMTPDGRYVALMGNGEGEAWVERWDRQTGLVQELVRFHSTDTTDRTTRSFLDISDDGRTVLFQADNAGLLPTGTASADTFNTFVWRQTSP